MLLGFHWSDTSSEYIVQMLSMCFLIDENGEPRQYVDEQETVALL